MDDYSWRRTGTEHHHFRCLSKDDVNEGMIMEARDILAVFEGWEPGFPAPHNILNL
jgi:hypothetical protein